MSEEQILILIERVIESKVLNKLPPPESIAFGNLLFYGPLLLTLVFAVRIFVVNGFVNKLLDYQRCRNEILTEILNGVKAVENDNQVEKTRLSDLLKIVGSTRSVDNDENRLQ